MVDSHDGSARPRPRRSGDLPAAAGDTVGVWRLSPAVLEAVAAAPLGPRGLGLIRRLPAFIRRLDAKDLLVEPVSGEETSVA